MNKFNNPWDVMRFWWGRMFGDEDAGIDRVARGEDRRLFCAASRATRRLLYSVVVKDHVEVARWIKEGADIHSRVLYGKTPILIAAAADLAVLKTLILNGACLEDEYLGLTPLGWAAHAGNEEAVKMLVFYRADLDAGRDRSPSLPLLEAAREGHENIVNILLNAGADLEAADVHGRRALMAAAEKAPGGTIKLLLNRGADKRATDTEGKTALDYATMNGRHEAMAMLT
ncbi:MAG: ankyrin repeat domain-containing protein [Verrucomicrobiae bacterium]|nr:ankyrin repeat domain-containing protein [Verrucomicrobiae bacterium]